MTPSVSELNVLETGMSKRDHLIHATYKARKSWRQSIGRQAYVGGLLIATIGATMLCGSGAALSGPCTVQIAQLERQIRLTVPRPESGPTSPQTLGAQLHYQPTPADVQYAESRANAEADAALQRARQADADGDAVACALAYETARHHWIFPAS
jgi:hypothetical protein